MGPPLIQHPAEGMLAVRGADWLEVLERPALNPFQLAIMRKGPTPPPQLTREGVGILEGHAPTVRPPNMGDHDPALDWVFSQQSRDIRVRARLRIMEAPRAFSLIKRHAPP